MIMENSDQQVVVLSMSRDIWEEILNLIVSNPPAVTNEWIQWRDTIKNTIQTSLHQSPRQMEISISLPLESSKMLRSAIEFACQARGGRYISWKQIVVNGIKTMENEGASVSEPVKPQVLPPNPIFHKPPPSPVHAKASTKNQAEIDRLLLQKHRITGLIKEIESISVSESTNAYIKLSNLADESALEPLVHRFYHNASHVKRNASLAVENILLKSDPKGKAYDLFLHAATREYDAFRPGSNKVQFIRMEAENILLKLCPKAVQPLISALATGDLEVRNYSTKILEKVAEKYPEQKEIISVALAEKH
jgi:hypothetical protein